MQPKTLMWILVLVFSTIGGYVPELWGGGLFSFSSIVGATLGGLLGIWLTFKVSGY